MVLHAQQLDNKTSCWEKASEGAKGMVRDLLLQLLGKADETRLIRRTVAEAIGSLAIKALPSSTLFCDCDLLLAFFLSFFLSFSLSLSIPGFVATKMLCHCIVSRMLRLSCLARLVAAVFAISV